jgi:hypothetical protein
MLFGVAAALIRLLARARPASGRWHSAKPAEPNSSRTARQILAEGLELAACGAGAVLTLDVFLHGRLHYLR